MSFFDIFGKRDNIVKRTNINADNIYDSNGIKKNRRVAKKIANERYHHSREPLRTGIVPGVKDISDNDSVFSDDTMSNGRSNRSIESMGSIGNDHMAFFKKSNIVSNNNYHENKIKEKISDTGEPGYFAQFEELQYDNPTDPVSANNTPHKTGKYANIGRLEMERDLALKGNYSSFDDNTDMTYGVVGKEDFVHNNMVPHFKRGIGKGYGPDSIMQEKWNDIKQRKVDRFTGSVKNIEYRPKTERRPLFNPQVGLTWIYGTPNFTDYMAPRYIPSKERRNEFIHQPVRQTPGLNLGYNEVAKHGYHDTWRPLPKTVDELRTASDPKISYSRPVIPGLKYDKRGIIPNVAKRKPVTFFENDPRDFVKGTSYYRAPSIYGNYEVPHTTRQQTTRAWAGPAKFDPTLHKPESLYEKHKISHKENFKSPTPRNIGNKSLDKSYAYDYVSNIPDPTKRNTYEQKTWNNAAKPEWSKGQAFDMVSNIPDPTIRNTTELKTWNNAAKPEWSKGQAFDMISNIPDPTFRHTTEIRTQYNPAGPEWSKGYAYDYKTNIPDPTLRNLTEVKTQYNPAGPEWSKGYAYDYKTNIPDSTLRNLTEVRTQYNPAGPAWSKGYAYDYKTNIPDPTLRNLTEVKTQYNPAGPEWSKGYAYDYKTNIPDPTIRNTTEVRTQYNPAGPEWSKSYAYDYKTNIPDPTIRNTTEIRTQYNPAGPEWSKSYAYDYKTNIPDPTIRNTTEVQTQYNPAGTEWSKSYAYDYKTNIPDPTLRNMTEVRTQYGPLGYPEKERGGYMAAQEGTIAPPTLRQLTQKTTQYNPAILHEGQKTRTRDDAANSLVNIGKEKSIIIRDGGAPTTSNYEKSPTYEHTMVQLCEPIQVNRELYGNLSGQRPLQCVPTMYTRIANVLPHVTNDRIGSCVTENLKGNIFINNTQHKAVEY